VAKQTDTKPLRDELAKAAADNETATVYALLERTAPELAKVLPEAVSVDAFSRSVLAEVRRQPQLLECPPDSLVGAMLLAVRLGLEPGPLGLVYLVPGKGAVEFVIGYRGYIDLAYRSGHVRDIAAGLVYAGEPFEYRKGTRPFLDHSPEPTEGAREVVAAYAVARLKSGGSVFEVIYEAEWEAARQASAAGAKNSGPWHEHRGAMIRKTAVRRLEPVLPKSALLTWAVTWDDSPGFTVGELADSAVAL
jgi:recombination protein RecT